MGCWSSSYVREVGRNVVTSEIWNARINPEWFLIALGLTSSKAVAKFISKWVLFQRPLPSSLPSVSPWDSNREQMDHKSSKTILLHFCLCTCDLCIHSVEIQKMTLKCSDEVQDTMWEHCPIYFYIYIHIHIHIHSEYLCTRNVLLLKHLLLPPPPDMY